ncbi:MAG: phage tail tape measure protein, partial [Fusobacteriaceae bacterium]
NGKVTSFSKSEAASEARSNLFHSMPKRDKSSYMNIEKQTASIMEALEDSILKGFGDMESADLIIKVEAHAKKINRMLSDTFLFGLGIPKEIIKEKVDGLNRQLMKEVTDGMSGKVKRGEIAHGPREAEGKAEFKRILDADISGDMLMPLIEGLNEIDPENTTGTILKLERLNEMMIELANMEEMTPRSIQDLFQYMEKLSKDSSISEFVPQYADIKSTTQRVFRDTSRDTPGESINVVEDTREDVAQQNRVANFNMGAIPQVLGQLSDAISGFVDNIYDVEKEIHSIGVIAKLNAEEIDTFRMSVSSLASALPYTSEEISKVYGEIIRTGKSLEEAGSMVKAIGDLAMATFEDIGMVSTNITSIMNAMELAGDRTQKVTEILFNALTVTPLSFSSLSAALTQTGAAFNSLIDMTSKSGAELEEYKMTLMRTQASMIGGMSLLGKTGSQAGTAIRNAVTRVMSMEQSSITALDNDLNRVGGFVSKSGTILKNSGDLSKLAAEDYNEALQVMSEMQK